MKRFTQCLATAFFYIIFMQTAWSHTDHNVVATKVGEGLYMLQGQGGNIGLSIGEDGAFLIDDQYAEMSAKILAKINELSPDVDIRFLLNTHWHTDHTDGNENFANESAIILAHDNVRQRLADGGEIKFFDMQIEPAKKTALPVITFSSDMNLHFNGQHVEILHIGNGSAHTDGDAIVFFNPANVIHTGDIFFNLMYPFIDKDSGGSIKGVIDSADEILTRISDQTVIIPGHGPLATKIQLQDYRDMLVDVSKTINSLKSQGKTVEDVINMKPTAQYDDDWGNGLLSPERWVTMIYDLL